MTDPAGHVEGARAAVSALIARDRGPKNPPLRPLSEGQIELLSQMQRSYEAQISLQAESIGRLMKHLKHDCPQMNDSSPMQIGVCEYLKELESRNGGQ